MPAATQVALTTTQRNLYHYFLHHMEKKKVAPCYVPRCQSSKVRIEQYITAVLRLEERGLIKLDKSAPNYTAWIMLKPDTQT